MASLGYPLAALVLILGFLLLAGLFGLGPFRRKRRKSRSRRQSPVWRSSWGTVYVHRFVSPHPGQPQRFKVGYTAGLTRKRQTGIRSKVKAATGEAPTLVQVIAVDMHLARKVEKLVLKTLEPNKSPIGTMAEFFQFPAHADPDLVERHIEFIVRSCAQHVRRDALKRGRWNDDMEIKARLVRRTPDGRLLRRPLFIDPAPFPTPNTLKA